MSDKPSAKKAKASTLTWATSASDDAMAATLEESSARLLRKARRVRVELTNHRTGERRAVDDTPAVCEKVKAETLDSWGLDEASDEVSVAWAILEP